MAAGATNGALEGTGRGRLEILGSLFSLECGPGQCLVQMAKEGPKKIQRIVRACG